MTYETILTQQQDGVLLITLNRPQAMNALNSTIIQEVGHALTQAETNPAVGCAVITGNEKAFAAGADIKEMASKNFVDVYKEDFITKDWRVIEQFRKPLIAAVAGYALGGGCELAMICDFILAAENAKFGQPEVTLGIIPGAGGTQRLSRYVGKSKAMELCLTGRQMDAQEAERCGLVSRVLPMDGFLDEVMKTAKKIATLSQPITIMIKESVNRAFETTLSEGIRFERRLFHATFATEDQKEGMTAFIEKRPARFKHQ